MSKFIKFSDIGQFRTVISNVRHDATYIGVDDDDRPMYDNTRLSPTITFNGTVKLHGTNVGVVFNSSSDMWVQSRKNIITPAKDNAGCASFIYSVKDNFQKFDFDLRMSNPELEDKTLAFFGEWCGGNVQSNVSISGLPKMFVMFAVKVAEDVDDGNVINTAYYLTNDKWKHLKSENNRIYNINDYDQYSIDIDFEKPEFAQSKMIEYVNSVEEECPVGKAFGRVKGEDNTTGEGIVWVGWHEGKRYVFKTKGEKHSTSKVKTLAAVDVEKLSSINEFVDYVVTENRLNQAIEQVFTSTSEPVEIKRTGDFLRWVINDVMKEENDTLVKNGLESKDVNRYISKKAQLWFMNKLDEQVGI